ncbi:MAG: PRC-barrel domain-containing protein [Burkholderiaceae bacterium]|nr:PRC-barrel domain-containing protein [Burkholderiaceae bacterium]
MKTSRLAVAALGAMTLATAPCLAQAQQASTATAAADRSAQKPAEAAHDPIDIRRWDTAALRGGHSAERLLDTTVRGEDGRQLGEVENFLVDKQGRITGIIVESQGFLEVGDTHFLVPWKQVEMGPNLSYVKVPVNERNLPDFSLFNDDESIYKPGAIYRGNELLGEFVRLKEGAPYGYIYDVIFSDDGRIQSIIVSPDRRYGYGYYAFPYYYGMYHPGLGYYDMPYARSDLSALKPFDYAALGIAGDDSVAPAKTSQR